MKKEYAFDAVWRAQNFTNVVLTILDTQFKVWLDRKEKVCFGRGLESLRPQ